MPRVRRPRASRIVSALSALFTVFVIFAIAMGGCTSPTLPLPPPVAPLISVGTEPETFRLSSVEGAEPNALIVIVNRNESLPRNKRVTGTIADERGSWDTTVFAKVGDILDVSQETGNTRSPGTTVTVR